MKELLEILENLRPDVDFTKNDKLIEDHLLDSFDIVALVGEINETFEVQIGVEHLLPENFNSIKAIKELIERLQQ